MPTLLKVLDLEGCLSTCTVPALDVIMATGNGFKCNIIVSTREASVEAFGAFQRHLKLSLSKMRSKYIDHCNQMSGRKLGS